MWPAVNEFDRRMALLWRGRHGAATISPGQVVGAFEICDNTGGWCARCKPLKRQARNTTEFAVRV